MLNQRLTAARAVADDLFKFENAIDDAIALGAQLSSQMVTARLGANLSAVVGQDAIDGVLRTLTTIANARRELVETHHHLKTVADDIGLRTVAFGDAVKPPKAVRLHSVA
jgi:hypothetical protein